jgi:hypothetical protein
MAAEHRCYVCKRWGSEETKAFSAARLQTSDPKGICPCSACQGRTGDALVCGECRYQWEMVNSTLSGLGQRGPGRG